MRGSYPVSKQVPQFSGGLGQIGNRMMQSASGKLIPVFQAITEIFIAAFLAQDLVAMVLPRIQKSLVRGANEVPKDPNDANLSLGQLIPKRIQAKAASWNWANAAEEFKREMASGPGLLMIPAVIFTMARRLMGKSAGELSHGALITMSRGFIAHLEQAGLATTTDLTPDLYKRELATYLSRSFCDPALDDAIFNGQTYRQYIDEWAKKWTEAVFGDPDARGEALEKLSKEFKEEMTRFNRTVRMGEDTIAQAMSGRYELKANGVTQVVDRPLHRSDFAWTAFGREPKHQALGGLLDDLRRWSDYAQTVWKEKTAHAEKSLAEVAETTLKRLVNKKLLWGVATVAASSLYLIKVTKWAMSHDSYQANRLLTPGAPASGATAPAAAQPGGHAAQSGPAPAHGGQPA